MRFILTRTGHRPHLADDGDSYSLCGRPVIATADALAVIDYGVCLKCMRAAGIEDDVWQRHPLHPGRVA